MSLFLGFVFTLSAFGDSALLTLHSAGNQGQPLEYSTGDKGPSHPSLSSNGQWVVTESDVPLVTGVTQSTTQIYAIRSPGVNTLLSQNPERPGQIGNGNSSFPDVSGDGRIVAFTSNSTNLGPFVNSAFSQVFILDRDVAGLGLFDLPGNQSMIIASRGHDGSAANGASGGASISSDGRYVAFASGASNLMPRSAFRDNNRQADVFVYDRLSDSILLVSRSLFLPQTGNGESGNPKISGNGRFVAFHSTASNLVVNDTNGKSDIFVFDRWTQETILVSRGPEGAPANNGSFRPSISDDGMKVAFESDAYNLVPNDNPPQGPATGRDIFVADLLGNPIRRVSISSDGIVANRNSGYAAISGDASKVFFTSSAKNLTQTPVTGLQFFRHDLINGETVLISQNQGVASNGPSNGGNTRIDFTGERAIFMCEGGNLLPEDPDGKRSLYFWSQPQER